MPLGSSSWPTWSNWDIASICYFCVAAMTFIPVLRAMLRKVKLHDGGSSFSQSTHFDDEDTKRLEQNFSRIRGTLVFWKNKAEWNKRFHVYTLSWTIPVSLLVPIVSQSIGQTSDGANFFLTLISSHTALLIAFHRALKVENNFKAFRHGESEFYDLYRRLLDRPDTFGEKTSEQINNYFTEVERIRKSVRIAETDNLPMLESKPKQDGK